MKALKYEEVHCNEYRDLNEARSTIRTFLEKIYNQKRLQSAIGYVPPTEFEANLIAQQKEAATAACRMFLGIRKSSDPICWNRSGNGASAAPGLIVSMSFQLAIPRRIASPAGSASASPTVDQFALQSYRRSILFHRAANCTPPNLQALHPTRKRSYKRTRDSSYCRLAYRPLFGELKSAKRNVTYRKRTKQYSTNATSVSTPQVLTA